MSFWSKLEQRNVSKAMNTNRWRFLSFVLIGLGLIVSGYLLFRSFSLMHGSSPGMDMCSKIFGTGCDDTLLSSTSWQMGIPLAGWGAVYYTTLACLVVLAWVLEDAFEMEAILAALLLAAFGAFASITLLLVLVGGKTSLCPLCMVIHIINLTLVPLLWRLNRFSARQLFEALKDAAGYMAGRDAQNPREARWKVLGFVFVALISVVTYHWVFVESKLIMASSEKSYNPAQVAAAYASTPEQSVIIEDDDPIRGPADAPAKLIVFSSFQCSACRAFADLTNQLTEHYRDKLAIIYKHFPLGKECNPALQVDMFPCACEAAWAAEAARLQGKFWVFHDALLASDLNTDEEAIQRVSLEVGLDLVKFESDRRNQATRDKVMADIESGIQLGVDGTPFVYLNGRRVQNLSIGALALLIQQEITADR